MPLRTKILTTAVNRCATTQYLPFFSRGFQNRLLAGHSVPGPALIWAPLLDHGRVSAFRGQLPPFFRAGFRSGSFAIRFKIASPGRKPAAVSYGTRRCGH